jgi:hypothetical protein
MLPTPWDISAHLDLEFTAAAAAAAATAATFSTAAVASTNKPTTNVSIDEYSCTAEAVLKHLPQGSTWLGEWSGHGSGDDVRAAPPPLLCLTHM